MVNSRVVVLLACSLLACDKGTKPGPTCDQAATAIVGVRAKGEKSVHTMEAKAAIVKSCTDTKWSDDARTCITKATSDEELATCSHDKLTGSQADKLRIASAGLSSVDEVMAKMRQFADEMCKCTDAKCAQAVSDEMTKWGQEESKKQTEPPKMTDDQMKDAQNLGQRMGECMTKAFGADTPPVEGQGNPNTDGAPVGSGAELHEGDVVNGHVISK